MSHVMSVPLTVAKWLRLKSKAYRRRKQRVMSCKTVTESPVKKQSKTLLRSQTVGCIPSDVLSRADDTADHNRTDKHGVIITSESQDQIEDRKTVLHAWEKQKSSTPIYKNISTSTPPSARRKKRFSRPAIRIDKVGQIPESREVSETQREPNSTGDDDESRQAEYAVDISKPGNTPAIFSRPGSRDKKLHEFLKSSHVSINEKETLFEDQTKGIDNYAETDHLRRQAWGVSSSSEGDSNQNLGNTTFQSRKAGAHGASLKSQQNKSISDHKISPADSIHVSSCRSHGSPPRDRHHSPLKSRNTSPVRSHPSSTTRCPYAFPTRNHRTSPIRNHPTYPMRSPHISSPRKHGTSPTKNQGTSPKRHHRTSPMRNSHASPVKNYRTSPMRSPHASPMRNYRSSPQKSPHTSPMRGHRTSTLRSRQNSHQRSRSISPHRSTHLSPMSCHASPVSFAFQRQYSWRSSRRSSPLRNASSSAFSSRQSTPTRRSRGSSVSSKKSSSGSRHSTPDSRQIHHHTSLEVPFERVWATRQRSPSPRSWGSVTGSYYSPESSRTPSREPSSAEEWDEPVFLSPSTSARRSRSIKRRRESFSGFKSHAIKLPTNYRDIVYPKIPDVEPGFEPLVRFRRAVKSVQVLLRATDRSRHTGQITTPSTVSWVQIHNDLEINKRARAEKGLLFDPDDYRAKRELQLSSEAKAILSMEPSKRTAEQLHVALVALNQSVEAFSEFPIKMQESLVRVGYYEHFEANRVIIRQGHFADNFYLIITGLAVVTILETDKQTGESSVRTAAFLKKGKSFGELALMHGALRSATVTCKDSVELLAVGRQDFINVFMHVEKNREPEHIQYLRSIDTFYGWPIEKLPYDNPKICLFTFFRKGVLLCRDSILSDWVYIIKTGTCKVLKELRIPKSDFFGKSKLNKTGSANHSSKTRTSSGQHGPSYLTTPSSSSSKSKRKAEAKRKLPCVRARCETELKTSSEEHLQKLTKIYSRVHPEPVADSEEINHTDKEVSDPIEASTSIDRNVSGNGNNNSDVSCTDILDPESEGPMPNNSSNSTRTTDQSRMKPKCNPNSTCPEPNSVFVQVARLGPKDVFGLEHPILSALTPATSMSLVSDGAECILINRKFFMQHLTDVNLKRLRLSMQPYPTEEDLKRKLQNKQDWIAYKTRALNDHLAFTRHVQDTLSLYY